MARGKGLWVEVWVLDLGSGHLPRQQAQARLLALPGARGQSTNNQLWNPISCISHVFVFAFRIAYWPRYLLLASHELLVATWSLKYEVHLLLPACCGPGPRPHHQAPPAAGPRVPPLVSGIQELQEGGPRSSDCLHITYGVGPVPEGWRCV
jgi:hypothetical protein